MEQELIIAEILRNKPQGIKLYSPIFGNCTFCYVKDESSDICVRRPYNEVNYFNFDGVYHTGGECLLFPSNEMRDWSKFAWKKGDVMISNDGGTEVDGQHHFCQEFGAELFKDGAKWAINEFLKNLWHPASEEPREFAEVLAEAKITESIKTYISFKRNDSLFKNWDAYSSGANITRWLYINDLFQKKGDKQ